MTDIDDDTGFEDEVTSLNTQQQKLPVYVPLYYVVPQKC